MSSIVTQEGIKQCKVIFFEGKGYCIIPSKLNEVRRGYFLLPILGILLDKLSYSLFKEGKNKAFVAALKSGEKIFTPTGDYSVFSLKPLKDDTTTRYHRDQERMTRNRIIRILNPSIPEVKEDSYVPENDTLARWRQGRMEGQELDTSYEAPEVVGRGAYGSVEAYPSEKIAVKTSSKNPISGELPQDMVKEIAVYRLLSEITCLPVLYDFEFSPIKLAFQLGNKTLQKLKSI